MSFWKTIWSADYNRKHKKHIDCVHADIKENTARILANPQEIILLQKETEQLVISTSKILLQQNFELRECTTPRLFIVLPDKFSTWDPDNILNNSFRLHFLCECGNHTLLHHKRNQQQQQQHQQHHYQHIQQQNCYNTHTIHITDHDGYLILQPTEFLKKYGRYLRLVFEMLKVGVQVSGLVVPALGKFRVDTFDNLNDIYGPFSTEFVQGMDKVEQLLQTNEACGREGVKKWETGQSPKVLQDYLDEAIGIEGSELRALSQFLEVDTGGSVLGNLYRVTTDKGEVKWVCGYHRPRNIQDFERREATLEEAVKAVKGSYCPNLQKIAVSLSSKGLAVPFYNAVQNSHIEIVELDVQWTWNQGKRAREQFQKMVCDSNIKILTFGFDLHSQRSFLSTILYMPLVNVLRHSSLQHVTIKDLPKDFFDDADLDIKKAPLVQLESLTMNWRHVPPNPKRQKELNAFLNSGPKFRTLNLVDTGRDYTNSEVELYLGDPMALTIYKKCLTLAGQYSVTIGSWVLIPNVKKVKSRPTINNVRDLILKFGNRDKIWSHFNSGGGAGQYLPRWVQSEMDAAAVSSAIRQGEKFQSLAICLTKSNSTTLARMYSDICQAIAGSTLTRFHCVIEQQEDLRMIQSLQWRYLQHLTIDFSRLEDPEGFQAGLADTLEQNHEIFGGLETFVIEGNPSYSTVANLVRILDTLPSATLCNMSIKVPLSRKEFEKSIIPCLCFFNLIELTVMIRAGSKRDAEKVQKSIGNQKNMEFRKLNMLYTPTTTAQAKQIDTPWT